MKSVMSISVSGTLVKQLKMEREIKVNIKNNIFSNFKK